ncbi:MAG: PilT/PilU family type 4a pilus ATPase [Chloroflexi bacterium]|nr:PilT/PilU family type 4a pilus ATPase [Chloroflexota bacterium]
MDIRSLLATAKASQASDLHLVVGTPPMLRVHGSLCPVPGCSELTPEDTLKAFCQIAADGQQAEFEKSMELDFGLSQEGVGRVRCNAAKQQGSISLVMRLLPESIPSIEELGLPKICKDLVARPRGLIVVSGPTGSGKSTTLAAMIQHLNATESRRVVTIEDPIEYLHPSRKCLITQRQLGTDTTSFAEALRRVLRQDPDIILVGEMRDTETAAAVMTIAETGHLVLTTGHAPSAARAVERIIDLFPAHERHLVQSRLATSILGIFCQALVPRTDGKGRVAAVEVMLGNAAVRNLVRDGKIYQIPNVMQTHSREGMILLDQSLVKLHAERLISYEHLLAFCEDREQVQKLCDRISVLNHSMQ